MVLICSVLKIKGVKFKISVEKEQLDLIAERGVSRTWPFDGDAEGMPQTPFICARRSV